ncbi:MAG: MFS transporter [Candidatus Thermoplasmatota archaeon]|nr:MFS transporter [Candidatus Thermoplasmatota archaeon]MEC8997001.1 MFS transporter [Candidatus Thermoplasmatota archaeon]
MSPVKRILSKTRELKEKVKEFNEERKKPKESITTKTSMFSIVSWAFYDLGNTIFSILIVSFYFSLWVVSDSIGGTDSDYAYANSMSMLLVFLTAPIIGALSDQARRRMPFLFYTTLMCVAFTALLGYEKSEWDKRTILLVSLGFFIVANYFYQAGLIFYDSTLATISTPGNRGRIGGIGIGIGYVGSLIGLGAGYFLIEILGFPFQSVFQATAMLFLIFAIPCFIFVKETPKDNFWPGLMVIMALLLLLNSWIMEGPIRYIMILVALICAFGFITTPSTPLFKEGSIQTAISGTFKQLRDTLSMLDQFPGLSRFLVGRLFYTDAANTSITFAAIYVSKEFGMTTAEILVYSLMGVLSSIVSGFLWGYVVDVIGPKYTLNMVLWVWFATFTLLISTVWLGLPVWMIWLAPFLAGIALGGTWCADRPYMLVLTPPRYIGQFYGLYSMVGRFATIIGPLSWGIIVDELGLGRPAAIAFLFVLMIIGYIILQGVDDEPREWPSELQVDYEPEAPRGAIGRPR